MLVRQRKKSLAPSGAWIPGSAHKKDFDEYDHTESDILQGKVYLVNDGTRSIKPQLMRDNSM